MGRTSSITTAQAKTIEAELKKAKGAVNVAALARTLNIKPDVLRRWLKAKEKPTPEQLLQEGLDKIREGIRLIERSQKAKAGDQ